MLDKTDPHRIQLVKNLKFTLSKADLFLEKLGILSDYQYVLAAIEAISDIDRTKLTVCQDYELQVSTETAEFLEKAQNLQFDGWLPILDDREAHLSYSENLDKFKVNYKVTYYILILQFWIDIHFRVVKRELFEPSKIYELEKEKFQIDLDDLNS